MVPAEQAAVLGLVAWSGTGKTTLLEKLIPLLRRRGLHPALIKHAHHDFDIDIPGKDSYRLRHAGATPVIVASRRRWALIHESRNERAEPQLAELLAQLRHADGSIDLILVEGFKHEAFAKIELQRSELNKPLLYPNDPNIIAIACDEAVQAEGAPTRLDIDNPEAIADFIHQWWLQQRATDRSAE